MKLILKRFGILLLTILFCCPQTARAEDLETASLGAEPAGKQSQAPLTSVSKTGSEDDDIAEPHRLTNGDKINIKIYPEDEYIKGGEMEVSTEGNITLPLVGKIHVEGKTAPEAEMEISKVLSADYIVNPEVVIELKNENKEVISTESFLILGEVKKPGTYPVPLERKTKFTLLHAISLAGGFSDIANLKRVKIVRKAGGQRTTVQVNVEEVFNGSAPDMEIKNGDVIHVPESLF